MREQYEQLILFHQQLIQFNDILKRSMIALQRSHDRVSPLWRDDMRKEYDREWQPLDESMRHYITMEGSRYVELLSSKITALGQYLYGDATLPVLTPSMPSYRTPRLVSANGNTRKQSQDSVHNDLGAADSGKWRDIGIQMVQVANLPDPDDIKSEEDFKKITLSEMKQGLARLETMKRYIQSGEGANLEFWKKKDKELGLEYKDGYQHIYEAFFGDTSIKLSRTGNEYDIENGRHRIWLAKKMGIEELPARLFIRKKE